MRPAAAAAARPRSQVRQLDIWRIRVDCNAHNRPTPWPRLRSLATQPGLVSYTHEDWGWLQSIAQAWQLRCPWVCVSSLQASVGKLGMLVKDAEPSAKAP